MYNAIKVLLLATLTIGASVFAADVVDDAIKLSNSGVSEDVVQAWAEQQHGFTGTAENIIALKDHKVSDRVILALMKGNETVPLTSKVVQDHGWLRRADTSANAPARSYTVEENTQAPQVAPQPVPQQQQYEQPTTAYAAPATYVVPSTVSYVSYGYPSYYSGYYGYGCYPGYYGGYGYGYGYPGVALGFNFNFGHGYSHGYYGGGFHGGSGFSSGGGFHGHH